MQLGWSLLNQDERYECRTINNFTRVMNLPVVPTTAEPVHTSQKTLQQHHWGLAFLCSPGCWEAHAILLISSKEALFVTL